MFPKETLILITAIFCIVRAEIFPSTMEGVYAVESFHVVNIKTGIPEKTLRYVVDFASHEVKTKHPLNVVSRSYSPSMGGSDIIHFAGTDFRVPVTIDDGSSATALGCGDCDGVMGIGSGAKLWLPFQNAIFTAGSVVLDEDLRAFTSQAGSNLGWFDCLPGLPNICTTSPGVATATSGFKSDPLVGKVTKPVTIVFGIATPKTIVPPWLYEAFTQGRNVQDNDDPDDWPDISFKIPSTIPGTQSNRFTLRSQDVVTISRRTGYDLLLSKGSDDFTVVLGRSAWRSFMLHKRWDAGKAQVVSWEVEKHWSTYSLVMMVLSSVVFVYWKLSPSGAWKAPGQATTWGPSWKIMASAFAGIFVIVTYAINETQTALSGFLEVNVFLGALLANMVLWQIFSVIIYLTDTAHKVLGGYEIRPGGAEGGNIGRLLPSEYTRRPALDGLPDSLVHLTPRLWIVMCAANETAIILIAAMVFIENRVESLGTIFILFFFLFLVFNLVYYGITAFYISTSSQDHPATIWSGGGGGKKRGGPRFVWVLFWVCVILAAVSGIVVTQIFVMQPFMERHISEYPVVTPFASLFVYGAFLLLAITWAKHRVIYEEKTKTQAMMAIHHRTH
jgi:hypothetical protein